MIKILSIGNSFSQDAQRYLQKIAKNEGVEIKCVNLLIGGCILRTHYLNALNNSKTYDFEFNGVNTYIKVTLAEALSSDDWDYVTLQQASHLSAKYSTFTPYISKLSEYVKMYAPNAKILIHQTWAYEQGSNRLCVEHGYKDQHDMLADIKNACVLAQKEIGAAAIIPSGEVMMKAIDNGIEKIHRDTYHATVGVGRYLLGCTWFRVLTGKYAEKEFCEFDVPVDKKEIEIVKASIKEVFDYKTIE